MVPTWNYVMVQAWGRPRIIEDAAWLHRQLDEMTRSREEALPEPWQVSDAPEPFIAGQIKAIIGLEIPIARIEGKWKVSQNRSATDRAGVIAGLRDQPEAGQPMAALVAERSV